jgi:anaerobic magnesium-protoporphyrin IX monomethyl ester cyclase
MGLGAIIREWKKDEAVIIDAIAEGWNETQVAAELKRIQPDLLVTMPGFNTFPRDMATLGRLAADLPRTKVVCFGYLPSQYPKEVLERTRIDVVIRDEPELPFSDVYDCLKGQGDLSKVAGIAYRAADGAVHVSSERGRQQDLDSLPFPDHSLIHLDLYNESYLERPIGVIMSERGCPYRCNFCVRTFGTKLFSRSAESLMTEIEQLSRVHGIRNVRFMDDTFTLNRTRTMKLCQSLIDSGLGVTWTCLTRVDSVDAELLATMKRAGCKRMYIAAESGSQRILDYYQKGLTVEKIREQMPVIQRSGIEASIFFMVGAPIETDEDVTQSIELAKELDLDYIIVTKLQYWPGTELFAKEGENVRFDIFSPGELLYKPPQHEQIAERQRRFYREFYFRPRYFTKRLGTLLRSPKDTVGGFLKLSAFVLGPKTSDDFI